MILTILQARTSSKRLPGKVLKPILGKPMLWHEIERANRAKRANKLVVATSQSVEDNAIETLCKEMGVSCFRGSLDDVLDRFYQAAKSFHPDHVVRITGDCPLIDPEVMDQTIAHYFDGNFDYTSNCQERPTYPDGLDTEVMRFRSLEDVWRNASMPSEREHVTPFFYTHKDRFKTGLLKNPLGDLSALRWTVDQQEDFEVVSRIYEALYPNKKDFGMQDVLDWLKTHPEVKELNAGIQRNEGYQRGK